MAAVRKYVAMPIGALSTKSTQPQTRASARSGRAAEVAAVGAGTASEGVTASGMGGGTGPSTTVRTSLSISFAAW